MGYYAKSWKIGGVTAGPITPSPMGNGVYTILFERCNGATLEKLEAIDWEKPPVRRLPACREKRGLPEGYGFALEGISYSHSTKTYTATVKVLEQYLGDVTGYAAQVEELTAAKQALTADKAALADQLAEADEAAISLYEQLAEADETAIALYGQLEAAEAAKKGEEVSA